MHCMLHEDGMCKKGLGGIELKKKVLMDELKEKHLIGM